MIDKVFLLLDREIKKYKFPSVDLIALENSAFKVLISTILSARTRDEITYETSNKLFSRVKNVKDLEKLSLKEIEEIIKKVNYYKNKAKYLKKLPSALKYSEIPSTLEELIKLPGVGRKTANLVYSLAFNKDGICVDTHVHRIVNRLGYVKTKTPFETEIKLREKLPKKYWKKINTYFVLYGQNICRPISPFCSKCVIKKYCKRVNVRLSR